MIAIGHTSVGVVVGVAAAELLPATIPLPAQVVLVGVAGICSHYIMDLVPHGHYDFDMTKPSIAEKLKLLLDFVVPVIIIGVYLLATHGMGAFSWLVGAGILGAQLPDIVNGLRSLGGLPGWRWLRAEGAFHSSTHWHNPTDASRVTNEGGRRLGVNDAWQAAILVLAVLLLIR